MNYKIYSKNPSTHLIDIEAQLTDIQLDSIELQLPSWRPGRYELQNFAKNISKSVVGKKIKDLDIDTVGGASLTTAAFEQFVRKII